MEKNRKLFSKFKSIEQFRHVVKDYAYNYNKIYDPVTKTVITDKYKPKETLTFTGTVKNHGTNASVTLDKNGVIGAGKRTSSISIDNVSEHFGFSGFVLNNKEVLIELIQTIKIVLGVDNSTETVLYGEWSGKGVQKHVAVSEVPKHFYVFDFKVIENGNEDYYHNATEWYDKIPTSLVTKLNKIGVIFTSQVAVYKLDIDMESPLKVTKELERITNDVEAECPIGKFFGVSGVGEGVVWTHKLPNGTYYTFKVKGERHSTNKVSKLVAVDPEVINKIEDFVEYACTENRMKQGVHEIYGSEDQVTQKDKRIGEYLNWIIRDIVKEEYDVMKTNEEYFSVNSLSQPIRAKAQKYLFELMDKNVMG